MNDSTLFFPITNLYHIRHANNCDFTLARRIRNPLLTGLTGDEMQLLAALVRHPEDTDRHLAEISGLDLKKTTYLRTRMRKLGIFRYLRIPAFRRLGAEVFWACLLETGYDRGDSGASEGLKRKLKNLPGILWAIADGNIALVLGICRTRADVQAGIDRLEVIQGIKIS